ncbi:MAG: ribonuclease E/G, partial [Novosphingobium sp.]|nr:ribonuclease E/G [Novosphingobium sp.]
GVLEASTRPCPHCDGTGLVRTASSAGLAALRLIEDEAAKGKGTIITLYASNEASIYLLNTKRAHLTEIEQRYGVTVQVLPEGENEGAKMRVTSSGPRPAELPRFEPIVDDASHDEDSIEEETDTEDGETYANDSQGSRDGEGDRGEGRSRRRRRRGGRNRNRDKDDTALKDSEEPGSASDAANDASAPSGEGEEEGENREPRRKRRRRGGRGRNRRKDDTGNAISVESAAESDGRDEDAASPADAPLSEDMGETTEAAAAEEKPKRQRKGRRKADVEAENASSAKKEGVPANVEVAAEAATEEPRPRRTRRRKSEAAEGSFAETAVQSPVEEAAETAKPKRSRRKKPVASEGETSDPAEVASELSAVAQIPQAANDANGSAAPQEEKAEPRRGWWRRPFGQ